jgi:large subunit ribosomal protein L9
MKVILTKDVKGIGRKHETVVTADGYALNYLIPGKFAVAATMGATNGAAVHLKKAADRKEIDAKLLEQNMVSLAEAKIVIKAKANEKGHLYDGIGKSELADAVKQQSRIDLPEDAIKLEKPIKELGAFEIALSIGEIFGKFSVTIEAE